MQLIIHFTCVGGQGPEYKGHIINLVRSGVVVVRGRHRPVDEEQNTLWKTHQVTWGPRFSAGMLKS